MKKNGILNAHLAKIIASMGHSDKLVITDCGLPIPRDAELVDLALTTNIPRFTDTLAVIVRELEIEEAIIARELEETNPGFNKQVLSILSGISIRKVAHDELKQLTINGGNIAFVRTGEATSFANILLVSGVAFG